MEPSLREMRLGSISRGIIIAVLIGGYAWVSKQPAASLTATFLVAAGLQLAVLAIRRFVAHERQPLALFIFELIADGATVLLFALGVFGGIYKAAAGA
jgi:hypothetical protein